MNRKTHPRTPAYRLLPTPRLGASRRMVSHFDHGADKKPPFGSPAKHRTHSLSDRRKTAKQPENPSIRPRRTPRS
jgi:hypothetical protein